MGLDGDSFRTPGENTTRLGMDIALPWASAYDAARVLMGAQRAVVLATLVGPRADSRLGAVSLAEGWQHSSGILRDYELRIERVGFGSLRLKLRAVGSALEREAHDSPMQFVASLLAILALALGGVAKLDIGGDEGAPPATCEVSVTGSPDDEAAREAARRVLELPEQCSIDVHLDRQGSGLEVLWSLDGHVGGGAS
jgi:hypothetical protein